MSEYLRWPRQTAWPNLRVSLALACANDAHRRSSMTWLRKGTSIFTLVKWVILPSLKMHTQTHSIRTAPVGQPPAKRVYLSPTAATPARSLWLAREQKCTGCVTLRLCVKPISLCDFYQLTGPLSIPTDRQTDRRVTRFGQSEHWGGRPQSGQPDNVSGQFDLAELLCDEILKYRMSYPNISLKPDWKFCRPENLPHDTLDLV